MEKIIICAYDMRELYRQCILAGRLSNYLGLPVEVHAIAQTSWSAEPTEGEQLPNLNNLALRNQTRIINRFTSEPVSFRMVELHGNSSHYFAEYDHLLHTKQAALIILGFRKLGNKNLFLNFLNKRLPNGNKSFFVFAPDRFNWGDWSKLAVYSDPVSISDDKFKEILRCQTQILKSMDLPRQIEIRYCRENRSDLKWDLSLSKQLSSREHTYRNFHAFTQNKTSGLRKRRKGPGEVVFANISSSQLEENKSLELTCNHLLVDQNKLLVAL